MDADVPPAAADQPDWEPGVIPPRNTEWDIPFPSVREANAPVDAVRFVSTYSPRRRVVAGTAIALAVLVAIVRVVGIMTAMPDADASAEETGVAGFNALLDYRDLLIWCVGGGAWVWAWWRWGNTPVT